MQKTDTSIRALGLTYVAVDKPTRAGLKRKADAAGLPLAHYLRKVAEFEPNKTIPMSTGQLTERKEITEDLERATEAIEYAVALLVPGLVVFDAISVEDNTYKLAALIARLPVRVKDTLRRALVDSGEQIKMRTT